MKIKEIFETMEYGPAPESSAMVQDWIVAHKSKFDLFINGEWQEPSDKKYFDCHNPANKQLLAKIAAASSKDIDRAVDAASEALIVWKKISGHERARYLYAIARQIQKHSRLFSVLESLDNGKPIRETRDIDIPLVARHFYHHAGWAQLRETELSDYKEIGVIGQIIPWNFPLLMLSWKIAPALAMGNTIVLKPAEYTPLTALLFAEICQQIGLPKGVINIVTGDGSTGAALVNHPNVAKIAFTGSTEVGRIIRRAIAGSGKKLSLELGGKSPFIVFDDADIDSAVEGIVDAIWFNQGQVCCAGSRLLVQEGMAERFYKKLRARMEKLRVGNSLDKSVDIGAIVAPVQLKTIEELVQKGIDEGCELWQPSWACPKEGYFYPPSLFTKVSPSSSIAQLEIFGPVLVAMSFRTHEEAIQLANNTRYGLAASIWTENINLALHMAPKIKAGTVWINCTNFFDAASGFGGFRESGFGREGGKEGLYEYIKPLVEEEFKTEAFSPKTTKNKSVKENLNGLSKGLDRTAKLYIGGKQSRPDGGYSITIKDNLGQVLGEVSQGNRKDIRNAVEAAHAGNSWANKTGHEKAQVIYYIAENLSARRAEFIHRIQSLVGVSEDDAKAEFDKSIERIFYYAAWADKYDGQVHHTIQRNVTLAMPEPVGVVGIICPEEFPLLGFISTVFPAIAMGNKVIAIPSESGALIATDLYQIFDTSDLPGGTINIITGIKNELVPVISSHDDIDGIWYFGEAELCKDIEQMSSENMKRSWVNFGKYRNWMDDRHGQGMEFLRHASEIKNIWIPYGA